MIFECGPPPSTPSSSSPLACGVPVKETGQTHQCDDGLDKPPSLYQFPAPPPRQPAQSEPVTDTVPCTSRSLAVYWSRRLCVPSFPLRLWVGHSCLSALCFARRAAWGPSVSGQGRTSETRQVGKGRALSSLNFGRIRGSSEELGVWFAWVLNF